MNHVERYRFISMSATHPRRDFNEEHRLIMATPLDGEAVSARERLVAQHQLTPALLETSVARNERLDPSSP